MSEASEAWELVVRVAEHVMLPLAAGGELRPVRFVGAGLAVELSTLALPLPEALGARLQAARLRVLRALVPVDRLPEPSAATWRLAFALNDLLQCAHPDLDAADAARVLLHVDRLVQRAGAPANVAEALERHSCFAKLPALERVDAAVSWWSGSAIFRGQAPPSRLLAWRRLRKVRVDEARVPLASLPEARDLPPPSDLPGRWRAGLDRWFAATPFTAVARAGEPHGGLRVSGALLGVLATVEGRRLTRRVALTTPRPDRVVEALRAEGRRFAATLPAASRVLEEAAKELVGEGEWMRVG
ncbi:MAG: hypothetical protein IT376_02395 [Polyangiaceae bacterium]|nr:hypothetical protein [Polyangiaceae bacterium]